MQRGKAWKFGLGKGVCFILLFFHYKMSAKWTRLSSISLELSQSSTQMQLGLFSGEASFSIEELYDARKFELKPGFAPPKLQSVKIPY